MSPEPGRRPPAGGRPPAACAAGGAESRAIIVWLARTVREPAWRERSRAGPPRPPVRSPCQVPSTPVSEGRSH